MAAIERQTNEYFSYICSPIFQRKRTAECEKDAMDMLEAYLDFRKITKEEFNIAKHEIQVAPHDDAISDIMCKIRHKIKW